MPDETPFGLHHTGLTVSDLDRSVSFYRDVIGLEVVMEQEKYRGYLAEITGYPDAHVRMAHLALCDGGHRLELFQYLAPVGERANVQPRNMGSAHVCFLVEDIHSLYQRLMDAGVETTSPPIKVDTGANTGAYGMYLRDPDGITVELLQPAPGYQRSRHGSPPDLTINCVETMALRVPLQRRYSGSAYSMTNRCTIITRVHTRSGIIGEVYTGDTDLEQRLILDIIHKELAPTLLGRDAGNPEACWLAMEPATYDILRDRSLALQAIACLDSAIWDAFGKAVGTPLYRLWGGFRSHLPIILIGGYYGLDSQSLATQIRDYVALGVAGCKFKVGGASPEEDAARVRIAREAAGPDFLLMIDANQGYTRDQAVDLARRVQQLDVQWFEEPCRWDNDRRWMRDVRYMAGIPVTAGQSETTLQGVRQLMEDGAIDTCNFDSSWSGGPTVWRKAAGLAAAFGIKMAHHEEPQVASHLLASIPHGTFVECFDPDRDPVYWGLFANRPQLQDGMYTHPEGPGFGIELDHDFIRRYLVHATTTGTHS